VTHADAKRRLAAALLEHYSFVIDGEEDRNAMAETLADALAGHPDGLTVQIDEEIPQPLTVNRLAAHASLGEDAVVLELKVTHEGVILDVYERGGGPHLGTAGLEWDDLADLCH
jgi:hypothetical protein